MATGYSDPSNTVTATTTLPAPTLSSLEVSGDDITANYTLADNSTDGEVVIETSTDGGSTWSDANTTTDLGATTLEATDLLDETQYTVRISRRTPDATATSGTLQATTEPFTGIDVQARSVSFGWENPDEFTQDGYRIERRQTGVTGFEEIADVGPTVGGYTDSGLIPGTEYEYRVIAYQTGGSTLEVGSGSFTTLEGDRTGTRVPSTGWSVSVTHPVSGRVIRPDVINPRQVQYLPGPNMMPEIRLPVRRAPSWLESEFDNNPDMTVHLDGEELPIDELVNVEHEEGQTILIGEGGPELREVVDVEYNAERRPVAATDLVDANTTYTSADDSPGPETDTRVVQDASGESELGGVYTVSNTPPLEFTGGGLKPHRTAWTVEGEDATSEDAPVEVSGSEYSGGTANPMGDAGNFLEFAFTPEYDIPEGEFEAWWRGEPETQDMAVARWRLIDGGGSTVATTNSASYGVTGLEWRDVDDAFGWQSTIPALNAGETYTLRFEVDEGSPPAADYLVDVVAPLDSLTRVTGGSDATAAYTFDNDNGGSSGYLDGPEWYPVVDAVFDAHESAFSIVGGSVSVTITDTSAGQALALSNDRGATYPISGSNTTSVSGSFPNPGGTLTLKATLSRYSPQGTRSATPATGYDAQRLDAYELSADIEFESLLINQDYNDSIASVLNDILPPRYAWTYSIESGTPTITVDEPGNTVADRDPEISDAQITKRVQTYADVKIKGSNPPVDGDGFQGSTSFVTLNQGDIVPGSEAVTDGSGTQFTRDVDYEIRNRTGEIRILSGGSMTAGTNYTISYRYGVSATHSVPGASGDTLVRTIPGVTSDRQAEQIAYVLAEVYPGVATPRYEGEIIIPRFTQSFDPLEGLQLADFELPDAARPLSIRGEPELTPLGLTLRLGSAPSLEESLRGISEQVSAISDRV